MTKKLITTIGLMIGAVALVAGCSTVSTSASEIALQYGGGPFDSSGYVGCFDDSTKEYNDVNDVYRYYPTGQRDFSFGDAKGLDSAALTSTTKDAQEIKVTGTVKFTMNLSCKEFKDPSGKVWPGGTAQFFHELFGSKDSAYNQEGGKGVNDGWAKMLRQYMGFAVDREVDDNALAFALNDLKTNRAKKDSWEDGVLDGLPAVLKAMTGGVDVFKIRDVLLQQPAIRPELADALAQQQAAQIVANSAVIDTQAAATFPGGINAYLAYKQQQAVNEAIKNGKVKVIPIPAGSPVIINGN